MLRFSEMVYLERLEELGRQHCQGVVEEEQPQEAAQIFERGAIYLRDVVVLKEQVLEAA